MRFMPRRVPYTKPTWRPLSAWIWMVLAAVIVALTIWLTTVWLLALAAGASPGTDRANARLDAARTGLAAGAGAGAAIGLLLAFRRQHHSEVATALSDYDAGERRITELYTKAVEQLGSDKAAVRLGGLYALERLAQDHVSHRQTIVEVLCAYLRMPYTLPADSNDPTIAEAAREEQQVRQAAQFILTRHMRVAGGNPVAGEHLWHDVDLDLTDATLIDWNFHGCHGHQAIFIRTRFLGSAYFGDAAFSGVAVFGGAVFTKQAWFAGTSFGGDAWFLETEFRGDVIFRGVSFGGSCDFTDAAFGAGVDFDLGTAKDTTRTHVLPTGFEIGAFSLGAGYLIQPQAVQP
jgi:membrane protein implicated in regulation of membrane protease activity